MPRLPKGAAPIAPDEDPEPRRVLRPVDTKPLLKALRKVPADPMARMVTTIDCGF